MTAVNEYTYIIMPTFNAIDYTETAIHSFCQCTEELKKCSTLLIVDDGNKEKVKDVHLDKYRKFGFDICVINTEHHGSGFVEAVNCGLSFASDCPIKPNYYCIVNNDIYFTPRWLFHLIGHLSSGFDNDLDMVGPITNSISGLQQKIVDVYKNEHELYKLSDKIFTENYDKQILLHRLPMFCLLFKSVIYDTIGELDTQFSPGNFEDDDYCLRAIEAGFKLGVAEDVFIHHFGSVSFRDDDDKYVQLLKTNKKKFSTKWSTDRYNELMRKNNG